MNGPATSKVVVLHWTHPGAHREGETTVERPPSVLASVTAALRRALPGGLPPELERFYSTCDGVVVTSEIPPRSLTIVGLAEMFGSGFPAPIAVLDRHDGEAALRGGPFRGKLYALRRTRDGAGRGIARLDLLVRLRLVALLDDTSAIAVDLSGNAARTYYVHFTHGVWPLDLGFADLVRYAERFGARRWYLAFLSARATRSLGIDVAQELATSRVPFPAWDLGARARRGRPSSAPPPSRDSGTGSKLSGCEDDRAAAPTPAATIAQWFLRPPELDLEQLDDPYARDRAVLLKEGAKLVGEATTVALVADAVRSWLREPTQEPLAWAAVLLAATELAEHEVVRLADHGMPTGAIVVLAKLRRWDRAKLLALAEAGGHAPEARTRATFATAAKRL